jgi:hypothetical protein
MNPLNSNVAGAMLVAAAVTLLVLQHRAGVNLRAENASLRSRIDEMTPSIAEHDRLTDEIARARMHPPSSTERLMELEALKAKVQAQRDELKKLRTELAAAAVRPIHLEYPATLSFVDMPKQEWAFAGYDTPEAALQSMLWATLQGDLDAVRAAITPAEQARRLAAEWKDKTDGEIAAEGTQRLAKATGFEILNIQMSENEAHFTVYVNGFDQPDQPLWMDMKLIDGQWKSDASEFHRP